MDDAMEKMLEGLRAPLLARYNHRVVGATHRALQALCDAPPARWSVIEAAHRGELEDAAKALQADFRTAITQWVMAPGVCPPGVDLLGFQERLLREFDRRSKSA